MKLKTFYFISCLALLAAALYYAPFFLIVSNAPVKSDAVVLFLGGEKGTREKEARQLIKEGWAEYLIIPARNQVQKLNPDGTFIRIDPDLKLNNLKLNTPRSGYLKPKTASLIEDTHEEAIIARDLIERLGISSAILVSSPYHMRRIRIIADHVFKPGSFPPFVKEGQGGFKLYTVPTRYETPNDGFWLFNSYERRFVIKEFGKIGWFLLYSPFV